MIAVVTQECLEAIAALWTEPPPRTVRRPSVSSVGRPSLDRIQAAARTYLDKVPGAVSGSGGHDWTFHAASILVEKFALTVDEATPLLQEWNSKCEPPWDDVDLDRKLREAEEKAVERGAFLTQVASPETNGHASNGHTTPTGQLGGRAGGEPAAGTAAATPPADETIFSNFYEEEVVTGQQRRIVHVGHPVEAIAEQLWTITNRWPRRIGNMLFVPHGGGIMEIDSAAALFAWIGSQLPGRGQNRVRWMTGPDKVKDAQFYNYVRQNAECYDAVEYFPHHPRLERHFYLRDDPVAGGDGSAFEELLGKFTPASDIDTDLVRAFFLTLLWGGPAGQRPIWIFVNEEDDKGGGRGIGKSTVPQFGSGLVGGYIQVLASEPMKGVITRLLSKDALKRRVAIIDNVKTMRFSWPDLEGQVTGKVISGHEMYHGEGWRPNTLTWVMTVNGPRLSKDMASRSVIVKIRRPTFSPTWVREMDEFMATRGDEVIGDILAQLRYTARLTAVRSRWAAWEFEVLSHVSMPERCQDEIAKRATCVDDDAEETDEVRDAFVQAVRDRCDKDPDYAQCFIVSEDAANIVNRVLGENRARHIAVSKLIGMNIAEIKKGREKGRRGVVWTGEKFGALPSDDDDEFFGV